MCPSIEQVVAANQRDYSPIHTIAFEDKVNRRRMRDLAQSTGGTYRFVSGDETNNVQVEDLQSSNEQNVQEALGWILHAGLRIEQQRRRRLAPELIYLLGSENHGIRELAHSALVAISETNDGGPESRDAPTAEINEAQQRWIDYWRQFEDAALENRARVALRRAESLERRHRAAAARRAYQKIVADFPLTKVADRAREKLASLNMAMAR